MSLKSIKENFIIIASLAVSFVVILFGLIQTRRITKSVEEITDFSKEVAAGNFRKRLFLKEKGELGESLILETIMIDYMLGWCVINHIIYKI